VVHKNLFGNGTPRTSRSVHAHFLLVAVRMWPVEHLRKGECAFADEAKVVSACLRRPVIVGARPTEAE